MDAIWSAQRLDCHGIPRPADNGFYDRDLIRILQMVDQYPEYLRAASLWVCPKRLRCARIHEHLDRRFHARDGEQSAVGHIIYHSQTRGRVTATPQDYPILLNLRV
ncbi:hypothetical protein RSAG8_08638, partial [Rhizoctonia solani AG-8 WAC10335]